MPIGQKDPDIFITLEILGDATDLGLYCNPGWGQYADVNANYPQPGYAIWQSGKLLSFCTLVCNYFLSNLNVNFQVPHACLLCVYCSVFSRANASPEVSHIVQTGPYMCISAVS